MWVVRFKFVYFVYHSENGSAICAAFKVARRDIASFRDKMNPKGRGVHCVKGLNAQTGGGCCSGTGTGCSGDGPVVCAS